MSQLDMFGGRRIVHGTPITPNRLLDTLEGNSFCVSFAAPDQIERCIDLVGEDEVLILDNGAFSIWMANRKGKTLPARLRFDSYDDYRDAFWVWANEIQTRCPQAIAVIPDVIEGTEEQNLVEISYALRYDFAQFPERTMSIWHLDDSQDFLALQCKLMNFVGIGSTQAIDVQRHKAAYLDVINVQVYTTVQAIKTIHGNRPWIHLMRGLGIMHKCAWVDSADSTNVAVNHHRLKDEYGDSRVTERAARIENPIQAAASLIPLGETT